MIEKFDREFLLRLLHNQKHKLANDRIDCQRFAYITLVKYEDGTIGYSHSGMLPEEDIVKTVMEQCQPKYSTAPCPACALQDPEERCSNCDNRGFIFVRKS
jgi:hypothetical protein